MLLSGMALLGDLNLSVKGVLEFPGQALVAPTGHRATCLSILPIKVNVGELPCLGHEHPLYDGGGNQDSSLIC